MWVIERFLMPLPISALAVLIWVLQMIAEAKNTDEGELRLLEVEL